MAWLSCDGFEPEGIFCLESSPLTHRNAVLILSQSSLSNEIRPTDKTTYLLQIAHLKRATRTTSDEEEMKKKRKLIKDAQPAIA